MSVSISSVLIPAATLGAMGLFFGALLAVSSKLFHVEQDPRIGEVTDALPGANCGGCGHSGCDGVADALFKRGAQPSGCSACS